MITRILLLTFSVFLSTLTVAVNAGDLSAKESAKILFDGQEYSYKWSNEDLHEFTPGSQSVTEQWIDMVTVNYYPFVSTGEDLAVVANAVHANYKDVGGIVLGFETIPDTGSTTTEYLIAVVFGAPDAVEFAMVKFQMHDGVGASIAYAHREYGQDVANVINSWMEDNGTRIQDKISAFKGLPPYADFESDDSLDVLSQLEQAI